MALSSVVAVSRSCIQILQVTGGSSNEEIYQSVQKAKGKMKNFNKTLVVVFIALSNFSMDYVAENPYAILTDDYGILSFEDFELREDEAPPGPMVGNYSAFAVWQCFLMEEIQLDMTCEDGDSPRMIISTLDHAYTFYFRRVCEDSDHCTSVLDEWARLTDYENGFCVRAYFSGWEEFEEQVFYDQSYWTLDRIKTKAGCWSYFEGDCPGESEVG